MALKSSKLKTVLVDLSGTLHIENEVTPGAKEALEQLRKQQNLKIKFVTNTTKESRRVLHSRLAKLGFDIEKDEIISSLWAAREFIKKESLKPFLLVDDKALEDFEGVDISNQDEANAVVIGLAPDKFNWHNLNSALRLLLKGSRLIAIHEAKYYMTSSGLALGPGLFVKTLEYASGCQSLVMGKPSPDFFKLSLTEGSNIEDTFMIGDDVEQDIRGAQSIGIKSYLVKTGKYKKGDEERISPAPYQTVASFADAVQHILSQC